jgi:DNA-binding GntR family transcriptional regulator
LSTIGAHERSERKSKVEFVYEQLRASIISGERAPGDVLDKAQLAQKFEVSRQPLANAVDRLAYDGLVKVVPQRGSFVSKLEPSSLNEHFFVRKALEVELATCAADEMTRQTLELLDHNLRYQEVALEGGDYDGFYELDVRFHKLIHSAHSVTVAERILDRTQSYLERVRRMLLPEPGRPQQTLEEHKAIRDSIKRRSPSKAAESMRFHIDQVQRQIQKFVSERPELFENG